jgi:IMP dehydrogenase
MKKGLTYDDILLVPQNSPVSSRSDVDTSVALFDDLILEKPMISANMSTVTESEMANAMNDVGALGIVHRFVDIEEQVSEIEEVDGNVGGSVGIDEDYVENSRRLRDAGADFICVDIAHGHLERCVKAVEEIREEFSDLNIMAGNVATKEGVRDLYNAGADCVKVGIGGGSMCKTREVAGVGVPQATAVRRCSEVKEEFDDLTIVADGGVSKPGDAVCALMLGADSVMMGGLLAPREESAADIIKGDDGKRYKLCYGMASEKAREERESESRGAAVEGDSALKLEEDSVKELINSMAKGIRSGVSYCGGHNLEEARKSLRDGETDGFIRASENTQSRNGSFIEEI